HLVRAELAVCREQSLGGSPRARLRPYLRTWGARHQLLEQLRPLPISRKADPTRGAERARRTAAADLWRRRERPRLATCRGSLRRPAAHAQEGSGRRKV